MHEGKCKCDLPFKFVAIVNKFNSYGENISDKKIVKKVLKTMSPKF